MQHDAPTAPRVADAGPVRRRLDLVGDAPTLLRRLPALPRLVALVGRWAASGPGGRGGAVVAWDPAFEAADPFDLGRDDEPTASGAFGGGWIGAWGYRLGWDLETLPDPPHRPVPQPGHRIGYYDRVLRLVDGEWWFEQQRGLFDPAEEERRRERVLAVVDALPATPLRREHRVGRFTMTPGPAGHRAAVEACRGHILAGEIFQANVTARLEAPFAGDPLGVFCDGVEALAPAYAAYVDSPEGSVVSLSPELFLRRTGRRVVSSPIKGTAPLSAPSQDLSRSAKDRAENIMIVDVVRNDLGRVAVPGTVEVPGRLRVERHAVWHLVSDVSATLADGMDDGDLVRAAFPPASVTGAPKIRAMELLCDLEATAREAYTGAIGYRSAHAGLELNVAIRTFEIADGRIWLGVGGGITADSDPDAEYAECLTKALPLVRAVGGSLHPDLVPPTPQRVHRTAPAPPARTDDAVFDTLLVRDGRLVDPGPHLARLRRSCRELFEVEPDPRRLDELVEEALAGLTGAHRLRIDVRPGPGGLQVGVRAARLEPGPASLELVPLAVPGGLGAHKWADRRVLEGLPHPGQDHLVVDPDDGAVLETGRGALALVHHDHVVAPRLDGRALPSTGRERLRHLLDRVGTPLSERVVTLRDVAGAQAVVTVNALRGVTPVHAVRGVLETTTPGFLVPWLAAHLPAAATAAAAAPVRRTPSRRTSPARVLVVDNYDSFTYNLVQLLRTQGPTQAAAGGGVSVLRNDAADPAALAARFAAGDLTHLVLSPGPGAPRDAGLCGELVRRLPPRVPVLGICLGHQVVAEVFGARVGRAAYPVHGRATLVEHDGLGLHAGLPSPLAVGRYHSLTVDPATLPDDLVVTSTSAGGLVMGLRHRERPLETVQWHPESVLTACGESVLATFLSTPGTEA